MDLRGWHPGLGGHLGAADGSGVGGSPPGVALGSCPAPAAGGLIPSEDGGNAASRLTLTITLGEEKAFGCNEYFGPGVVGGGFAPSFVFMLLPDGLR